MRQDFIVNSTLASLGVTLDIAIVIAIEGTLDLIAGPTNLIRFWLKQQRIYAISDKTSTDVDISSSYNQNGI
ncbi:hypothetical protein [Candidatus Williamhamiltonella defendens]|uniref:hypothetical protein n=1 Tax=Candidatus Williamhamiltonella defendens TaxID=138072 RepID=UPI00130DB524|nr:hypothetical protein [Candidatus Hamiltonella defensa]